MGGTPPHRGHAQEGGWGKQVGQRAQVDWAQVGLAEQDQAGTPAPGAAWMLPCLLGMQCGGDEATGTTPAPASDCAMPHG